MLHNIWCIYKREMRTYATTSSVYVVMVLFTLISGYFFNRIVDWFAFASPQMASQQYGHYDINFTEMVINPVLMNTSIVMLFVLPILTMRLFAEEKRLGTAELLFSYPLRDTDVLLGKFAASVTVFTIMLGLTGINMCLLIHYGDPEIGPMLVGHLGLWLMGVSFISLGIFISSLTESQVVAAVGGLGSLLLLWVISWAGERAGQGLRQLFEQVSIYYHFGNMAKGVIETNDIVYYVMFTVLFLFLTTRSLESKKWRS
ncbi:MAG: ABC transporter permease subunit [Candidatus Hydrogenedentes bacterium]|nr:ABC transporter permease subunit [Candidatus Hydrogenedentota bacterium]